MAQDSHFDFSAEMVCFDDLAKISSTQNWFEKEEQSVDFQMLDQLLETEHRLDFSDLATINHRGFKFQKDLKTRQNSSLLYKPMWLKPKTLEIDDTHLRFHQEILDFQDWVQIKDYSAYDSLFMKVKSLIKAFFPNSKCVLFGSAGS